MPSLMPKYSPPADFFTYVVDRIAENLAPLFRQDSTALATSPLRSWGQYLAANWRLYYLPHQRSREYGVIMHINAHEYWVVPPQYTTLCCEVTSEEKWPRLYIPFCLHKADGIRNHSEVYMLSLFPPILYAGLISFYIKKLPVWYRVNRIGLMLSGHHC